ncbi:hypothetical protein STEG23_005694 [Scotinomys teguina]
MMVVHKGRCQATGPSLLIYLQEIYEKQHCGLSCYNCSLNQGGGNEQQLQGESLSLLTPQCHLVQRQEGPCGDRSREPGVRGISPDESVDDEGCLALACAHSKRENQWKPQATFEQNKQVKQIVQEKPSRHRAKPWNLLSVPLSFTFRGKASQGRLGHGICHDDRKVAATTWKSLDLATQFANNTYMKGVLCGDANTCQGRCPQELQQLQQQTLDYIP